MKIYCCTCAKDVGARLTNGGEIYPHRPDLRTLPFWKCDTCKEYVGCHHKTDKPTTPLGNIPNAEIRAARKHIHALLDPMWKGGGQPRGRVYGTLSKRLGYSYHTGEIKTIEEARRIYQEVKTMFQESVA
jgi:hypothetical protein